MRKIGIGIIGLGVIGERLINVFNDHYMTEIISGYDADKNRMDYITEKFSVPVTATMEEIISDNKVDLVYIAVPPKYHHEIAMKVIKQGKHIFCEKPLAGTIQEAMEMYKAVKDTELINGMNFPLYYFSAYNNVKNILENKRLGTIKRVELKGVFPIWPRYWQQNSWIDTKDQGGFTREVFTHFIQIVQSSFGEIRNIKSITTYPEDKTKAETGLIATGELDGDITILFNGLTGIDQQEELTLKIYGTQGVLEMLNWRDLFIENEKNGRIEFEKKRFDPVHALVDEFVKAINGKNHDLVTFKDGYLATKVVETLLGE